MSVFDSPGYMNDLDFHAKQLAEQIKFLRYTQKDTEIFLEIRNINDALIKKSGLFEKASCKKGCSFCCHDKIIISKIEANHIKKVIAEKGIIPNRERLKKQKENDKACSLLSEPDEAGQRICTIYEDRPMICRSHNSMEEPKFCNKLHYPKRSINEGRILQLDAIATALVIVDVPDGRNYHELTLHDIL
jgi:Fe-S-cluster containining protein